MEVTCEIFGEFWKVSLGLLLFLSLLSLLLRMHFSHATSTSELPRWLPYLLFWGRGFVALSLLLLMVLGFVCAGSSGDLPGIVPN